MKRAIQILILLLFSAPLAHSIDFPPDPPKRVITHTVKKGEELHLLAGYYYLDCRQWVKIYQSNLGTIQNPNKLYPGQELYVIVDADWEPPFNLDEYVEAWGPYLLSGSTP